MVAPSTMGAWKSINMRSIKCTANIFFYFYITQGPRFKWVLVPGMSESSKLFPISLGARHGVQVQNVSLGLLFLYRQKTVYLWASIREGRTWVYCTQPHHFYWQPCMSSTLTNYKILQCNFICQSGKYACKKINVYRYWFACMHPESFVAQRWKCHLVAKARRLLGAAERNRVRYSGIRWLRSLRSPSVQHNSFSS